MRGYTLSIRGELRGHGASVTHLKPGNVAPAIKLATGPPNDTYRAAYARVTAARAREMAVAPPATQVAVAVTRLLRSPRPPAVVAVGGAAPLLLQIRRLLPDALAGRLTARRYGLWYSRTEPPGCSPAARAPALGAGDRRFESSHPESAARRPLHASIAQLDRAAAF